MNYATYMVSDAWKTRRIQEFERAGWCCEFCGFGPDSEHDYGRRPILNLHHVSYDRLGNEDPYDLIVLCRSCHEDVHEFPKRRAEVAAFALRRNAGRPA